MASARVKHAARVVVGDPDESVPVVSAASWIRNLPIVRDPKGEAFDYVKSIFPILQWIGRYNLTWAISDLIAGLTVGMVVVPQSMSYAIIATLPAQYGLYSAFVGVAIYCFFATSKDVSIGPVAVMSLTVSQIIKAVDKSHPKQWDGPEIATTVAFICGFIVLGIGLLRLGWLVEFIPAPAVSGFMTGSAINIAVGQVPALMGITGFDTRAATYHVIINTLKGLPRTTKDAAFGLTALFFLYAIRMTCDALTRKYPRRARVFFFISVLRHAFVLIVLTIAAWLYCRHRVVKGKYPIKILQTVPAGLKHVRQPTIDPKLVSALGSQLPVATIILLLEHIAISKSFGRVNNYKINPNQELLAIGVTNTVGSCFGAYPATGSFSRSALKSKSGVRTPLAGIVTAIVVIVALYGLTPAFFWIPSAALSAIIIHAVADLVAKPPQVYQFWRISPIEFVIWWAAVLVTVFSTIENGIYTSIASSAALLLVRLARPRGNFMGKVRVRAAAADAGARDVYVPLHSDVINPHVLVDPPRPGVLVYRFEESVLYPNSSLGNSRLVDYVKEHTRRGKYQADTKPGDRPWNDPGPKKGAVDTREEELTRPLLHAIVLDFSSVAHLDTSGTQSLVDTRNEVDRWADQNVEFHFATILSPWIARALIAGGFGTGTPSSQVPREVAPVVTYPGGARDDLRPDKAAPAPADLEAGGSEGDLKSEPRVYAQAARGGTDSFETLVPGETPFFHLDLHAAVRAAEAGLDGRARRDTWQSDGKGDDASA